MRCKHGFTLIELLVVVAIIALLISILLPHMGGAREQSRKSVCLANLRSMGQAMHMYFGENREWFPFEKRNWPEDTSPTNTVYTGFPSSAFYYGGHPGRPSTGSQTSYTFDGPLLRDTFRGRPFNRYLVSGELYDKLESPEEATSIQGEERRKDLRIFQCPSDLGGYFANETGAEGVNFLPLHHFNGSSYDNNYHFFWAWAAQTSFGQTYAKFTDGSMPKGRPLQLGNAFLKRQREKHAGTMVMLYEDPFDSALATRIQRVGWHRQLNRHSFLFLDGHAANMFADSKAGTRGPGWKTASGAWYYAVDDEDYQYRKITQ